MKNHPPSPADSAFLTVVDISKLLQIKQRTVWRWVSIGKLPEPVRFARSVVRWKRTDIEKAIGVELAKTG